MSLNIESLNQLHLDVLREIGNIGAGNAATALAGILDKRIDMNLPVVKILAFDDVTQILGGEETTVAGVYFRVEGDLSGNIMFLLDLDSCKILINLLIQKDNRDNGLDEMDRSALQEIGNILSGAYISALSSLTRLDLKISIPSLSIDMAGAILSVPAIQFGHIGDKVLMIETQLKEGSDLVKGHFFLIPDEESFPILLKSLGVYE
ncbi:CheC, inhibitor of MCP methylation [Alkaliphilus metalliredigens QYMF]|uniref:CheC, inhibitor of MCP methylation n=1 Tax=Alkaliphilus metalliredigens (strain QYMF) TaxID=293826 RepID=A6TRN0_ALKMQ|nr:chemotaxis protein CheC [Alkaliphilus metalliredigens]ABR48848.1 CheC, inhibitor of MCP methylation [Alkaliphilus metalliredigens QYMF]